MRSEFFRCLIFILCLFCITWQDVEAQYFGFNKPKYRKFDFRVLETPHFALHHYFDCDSTAHALGRLSEKWYDVLSERLSDTFTIKNPLIFYKHHADFQQTGVIDALIGVGTSGFAEGVKNRIVMPKLETNTQTSQVLGHEIVHAFQYNMLRGSDTSSLANLRNMPLWMVEGMAEYLSIGRQDSHTAMWMRDAFVRDDVPTLEQMSKSMEYFPYRFGQAFVAFFAGVWGDDNVRRLFVETGLHGYEMALRKITGFDSDFIYNMWINSLREDLIPLATDTIAPVGRWLFQQEAKEGMTFGPVISHNGRYMVFASEKDLLSIELYLAEVKSGRIIRKLSGGVHRSHIDDFNFIDAVGTFSPDNRYFAFPVFSKGQSIILMVNTHNGKVKQELVLSGVETFNSIDWSPDGRFLVFSAVMNGHSDLVLYDLKRKSLEKLTEGPHSDIQPAWSPDGRTIAFASDRGPDTQFENLQFGKFRICFLDIYTRRLDVLNIFPEADNLNPKFSPDGHQLYFLSDCDGFRNLYQYSIVTQKTWQLTRFFTGISGITKFSPAIDVAWQSGEIVYTHFHNRRYKLYITDHWDINYFEREMHPQYSDKRASVLSPHRRFVTDRAPDRTLLRPLPDRIRESRFDSTAYRSKYRLTYIGGNTMGVGGNHFAFAMSGGINLMFSDMLNDEQIFTGAQISGEIYDFAAYGAYLNKKRQVHWGIVLHHMPYLSSFVFRDFEEITIRDSTFTALVAGTVIQRTFQQQFTLFSHIPLSKYLRIEGNASFSRYSFRRDAYKQYYYGGHYLGETKTRIPAPDDVYAGQFMMALVNDQSYFGFSAPLRGQRYRFQVEGNTGAFNLWGVLADYRRYYFIKPLSLGFRSMYYGRYGRDADALNPLSVANDFLVRGYNINSFINRPCYSPDCIFPNQMTGTNIFVFNTEARLPFTGPKRLAQFKSGLIFSDLVWFADAGMAWNELDSVRLRWTPGPQMRTPAVSTGFSMRINLFGLAILEPYVAMPFQRFTQPTSVFGLFLSSGGW